MRKIGVCYPGDIPSVFAIAFDSMVNIQPPEGCEVRWFRGLGWCQARRRIQATEKAIEWGAEILVHMDIDQTYEPDVLVRLLKRIDEGYRIIAAMVPCRGYVKSSKMKPFQRLAWRSTKDGTDFEPVDADSDPVVERCTFPTSACVMFHAEDIQKLRRPWYFYKFNFQDFRATQGEDGAWFYRMREELGIDSYVDKSIRVNHCHVFEIDETFPDRFADYAESGPEALCNYD